MPSVAKPSFGAYLLAFFFPPGYFFSRKRQGAALFSLIMCVISIPLLFLAGFGVLFWFPCAMWAMWSLRHEMMHAYIDAQAQAIVDKTIAVNKANEQVESKPSI